MPEQARVELLDAAERLLSERGPDAIGLRDIAREAQVSHGLITHYFKTYEGLVEAVFARRSEQLAKTIEGLAVAADSSALVRVLIGLVSEPIHLRLVAWATLSGRSSSGDWLPSQVKALRVISDAARRAAEHEAKQSGGSVGSQEQIDYAVMLTLGAAYGYGLGKRPLLAGLDRTPDKHTDAAVIECLTTMLRSVLLPRRL